MATNTQEKILLAQETFDRYQQEYDNLINVERPAVQAALKEARAQGDLSENAEYDAARDKQAVVEGRIVELEAILANAKIIEKSKETGEARVAIGATVKYLNLSNNKENTVSIMGIHDANPMDGKISDKSPLAQAMEGCKVGEEVEVDVAKKYSIKILEIKFN